MNKSTKKYLLYGVGAYVLLTSGVIGATKVRERSNRLEDLGDDLESWKGQARQLERDYNEIVATLNSERAAHNAEVEALKAEKQTLASDLESYRQTIGSLQNANLATYQIRALNKALDKSIQQISNEAGAHNVQTLRGYLSTSPDNMSTASPDYRGFFESTVRNGSSMNLPDYTNPITLTVYPAG